MLHIDTESTGFSPKYDDILSISIVNEKLEVLFASLVRPYRKREWPKAMEVNGITPEMVKDAPKAFIVRTQVAEVIYKQELCAYNARFDFPLIESHLSLTLRYNKVNCCMIAFAEYMAKLLNLKKKKNYTLKEAALISGYVFTDDDKLHGSTTDAKICAHVWNWLDVQPKTTLF